MTILSWRWVTFIWTELGVLARKLQQITVDCLINVLMIGGSIDVDGNLADWEELKASSADFIQHGSSNTKIAIRAMQTNSGELQI